MVKMVSLALLVFRDHQVHVGCQVKVLWEEKVLQALLAQQDLQDHRACQESQDQKDFQAQEEHLESLVPQGYQVEMVVLEKGDSKERGENLDLQEVEASQVLQAHRVLQVFLVPKWRVRLFLDLLVHLDLQEILGS
jgi:hypothetical protein